MILEVQVLGGFSVTVDGRRIERDAWRKRRAANLVKVLALAPNHRLHRERLADVLWPEANTIDGANNLDQAVHLARRILAPDRPRSSGVISTEAGAVALAPDHTVMVDAEAFHAALKEATAGADYNRLEAALTLYTGDLLPDDVYAKWTEPARSLLRTRYVEAVLLAADQLTRTDQPQRRIRLLDDCLTAEERAGAEANSTLPRVRESAPDSTNRNAPRSDQRSSPPATLPRPATLLIGRTDDIDAVRALLQNNRLVTLTGPGGIGKTRVAVEVAHIISRSADRDVFMVELALCRDPRGLWATILQALPVRQGAEADPPGTVIGFLAQSGHSLLLLDNCEHLVDAAATVTAQILDALPDLTVLATSRESLGLEGEKVWVVGPLGLPGGSTDIRALRGTEAGRMLLDRAAQLAPEYHPVDEDVPRLTELCRLLDGIPLALELVAARLGVFTPGQVLDRLFNDSMLGSPRRSLPDRQRTMSAALDWSTRLLSPRELTLFHRLSVFVAGFTLEASEAVCGFKPLNPASVAATVPALVEKSLIEQSGGVDRRFRLLEPVRQCASRGRDAQSASLRARHARWYADRAASADARLWGSEGTAALAELDAESADIRAALTWCASPEGELATGLRLVNALWQHANLRGRHAEAGESLRAVTDAACLATFDDPGLVPALLALQGISLKRGDRERAARALDRCQALDLNPDDMGRAVNRRRAIQAALGGEYAEAERLLVDLEGPPASTLAGALDAHTLAIVAWARGLYETARMQLERARSILLDISGDNPSEATCLLRIYHSEISFGPIARALTIEDDMTFALRRAGVRAAAAFAVLDQGIISRLLGDLPAALRLQQQAVEEFSKVGDGGATSALAQMAVTYREQRDYARARELLERGLSEHERERVGPAAARTQNALGVVAMVAGDFERAGRLFGKALEGSRQTGSQAQLIRTLTNQGHLALFEGFPDRALALYQTVLAAAETSGNRRAVASHHRHAAIAAMQAEDTASATEQVQASLAVCDQIDDRAGAACAREFLAVLPCRVSA
jgi:predicted ATPase/DNA-binding SARP family transcriptional activator/Tfp pilus assembly protein PilF